jgi:hypothetical protein
MGQTKTKDLVQRLEKEVSSFDTDKRAAIKELMARCLQEKSEITEFGAIHHLVNLLDDKFLRDESLKLIIYLTDADGYYKS